MSVELEWWRWAGFYRDKERGLLIMTVMIEMLKMAVSQSNERCECWDGM